MYCTKKWLFLFCFKTIQQQDEELEWILLNERDEDDEFVGDDSQNDEVIIVIFYNVSVSDALASERRQRT